MDNIKGKKYMVVRCYLPYGYLFTMRPGLEHIKVPPILKLGGGDVDALVVANMGKLEGSNSGKKIFDGASKGLRSMYGSDKKRLKHDMLSNYDDLSREEIESVLQLD